MNTPVVVGTLFGIFCLWLLRHALQNLQKADQSTAWPRVTGRMTKTELWGVRNIDGEMKPADKLSVEYEYEVDGKSYSSSQVAFYTIVYPQTVEFSEAHPEGSEVDVYYRPEDPSESILVSGAKSDNKRYSEIIMASLGVLVSVMIVILGWLGLIGG